MNHFFMSDKRHGWKIIAASLMLAITWTAGAAEPYHGFDWPHWRGPDHNSVSREKGFLTQWPSDGPPIAWRAKIGIGFASMAVADGRVYAMGHEDENEVVSCFDAASGKLIWSQKYPGELMANLHEGGPGATPTVADGFVYTVGKQGQLHCYAAADGKPVWSNDLRKIVEHRPPGWGYETSAVIVGDLVCYQAGATVALDRANGQLKWMSKKEGTSYSTPEPAEFGGKRMLATLNSAGLSIIDVSDGRDVAQYPWATRYDTNATTPIISGNHIFLSTGYGRGCTLLSFDGTQIKSIYENKSLSNHIHTSVLYDGQIYGFDGQANPGRSAELVCMNFDDGKVRWRHRGLGCGSLLVADGKLIVLSDHGDLAIVDATAKGYQEIARASVLTGKCWTAPVLSHGRVYCRNATGDLVCVDLRPK